MTLLIVAALAGICLAHTPYIGYSFLISLILINLGLIITLVRRIRFIAHTKKPDVQ